MKKMWIITLVVIGFFFIIQQTVLYSSVGSIIDIVMAEFTTTDMLSSLESTQSAAIEISISSFERDTSGLAADINGDNPPTSTPLPTHTPVPSPTPDRGRMARAAGFNEPTNTPLPTHIPTSTPIPTHTPTPTPTSTPTPMPTPTPTSGWSTGGNNVLSNDQSLLSQLGNVFQSMLGIPSTKKLLPTNAPIPTITSKVESNNTTPPSSNTPIPTQTTTIPSITPTSAPASPLLPKSLTTQKKIEEKKTTYILDTHILSEIKIAPNAVAAEHTPTERPLLPQERQQIENNAPTSLPGGILVTLEQKRGDTFVTRQDELKVKRGNQFFTITSQETDQKTNTGVQQTQTTSINVSESDRTTASIPKTPTPPRLKINANKVIAESSMGLSVDPLSGILTVDTPIGPQKISIMPDEALGIVTELNALDSSKNNTPSLLLVIENAALIYRIAGERVEQFLGMFPVSVQKQILISADTGSVVKVELPLSSQILSFFTF